MRQVDGIEAIRILAGPCLVDPMAIVIIVRFDLDEYVHVALKQRPRFPAQRRRARRARLKPAVLQSTATC